MNRKQRCEIRRRHPEDKKNRPRRPVRRGDCGELTPKVQHLLRFCRRVEHSAAQHRTDFVETVFKRGEDSEVAFAAAHAQERGPDFLKVGRQQTPIGSNHIRIDDAVESERIVVKMILPKRIQTAEGGGGK